MAKKPEPIVRLAAQTARQISASSENYMAFLTTAAHNFKYSFRDQLLIFAQKPNATACAQTDFWNKCGRWVNRGTTGIALLVDTDKGYKLRHVFDMSDTNSRAGRTVPIWQMKPQYEGAVIEALENSFGSLEPMRDFPGYLIDVAKTIVQDNMQDYLNELCAVKADSFLEELDDLNIKVRFRYLLEYSVGFMLLTRCGYDASYPAGPGRGLEIGMRWNVWSLIFSAYGTAGILMILYLRIKLLKKRTFRILSNMVKSTLGC